MPAHLRPSGRLGSHDGRARRAGGAFGDVREFPCCSAPADGDAAARPALDRPAPARRRRLRAGRRQERGLERHRAGAHDRPGQPGDLDSRHAPGRGRLSREAHQPAAPQGPALAHGAIHPLRVHGHDNEQRKTSAPNPHSGARHLHWCLVGRRVRDARARGGAARELSGAGIPRAAHRRAPQPARAAPERARAQPRRGGERWRCAGRRHHPRRAARPPHAARRRCDPRDPRPEGTPCTPRHRPPVSFRRAGGGRGRHRRGAHRHARRRQRGPARHQGLRRHGRRAGPGRRLRAGHAARRPVGGARRPRGAAVADWRTCSLRWPAKNPLRPPTATSHRRPRCAASMPWAREGTPWRN